MEQFSVTGMSCAACAARVEKAVNKVEGVESCAVSLLTNSMGVQGNADPQKIIQAVKAAGYGASLTGSSGDSKTGNGGANGCKTGSERGSAKNATQDQDPLADKESPVLFRRLAVSLVFLLPLMYFSMGRQMFGLPLPKFFEGNCVAVGLVQLLLAAAVMAVNKKFFTSGFSALFRAAPNMDSLVALGSGASFAYSAAVLFVMTGAQAGGDAGKAHELLHDLYFEGAAMILALITVGKTLEARSKGKTTNALKSLMKLAPKTATVIRDGKETTIPAAQILVGEIFVVRPGQSLPVDGTVIEGNGAVDESALTGESVPVDKKVGDKVFGGTLNQAGFLKCQASRVGQDTTISQIIKMVQEAAATKAPAQKIADKVSGVFVPAVIAIAAVTVAAWLLAGQDFGFALARGISVLVISCPCALGLATPVAIMVANGVGAKNGILFKTAAALEQTGKTKIAALDKTGTITQGRPRVTDIFCAKGVSQQELLEAALSLESKSEHPLAKAVLQKASESSLTARPVTDFKALAGNGLLATDQDGSQLLGGSVAFVQARLEAAGTEDSAKTFPQDALAAADAYSSQGKTPLAFARANKLLGIIAVADVIKEDSAVAIKDLRALGIKTVMLTGDNQKAAAFVARQACVDQVIAGVLPDQKAAAIGQLKKRGAVAMVGDGINDAVALTAADIGIAIGAGADVAIDAADLVLAKNSLRDVVTAIRLSRACLRNIRQNLFWAFFYNVLGIPLAAGAWIWLLGWKLNPMFGAAAMSLSSFCVVTNALRLNFFRVNDGGAKIAGKPKTAGETKNSCNTKTAGDRNKYMEASMKKTLKVEGMMCGHCEARVVKALQAVEGVASATASHDTGLAVVELSADVSDDALKAAVEAQDYKVLGVE